MDAVYLYISENWVKWLFAIALTALSWGYRTISQQLKLERQKNEAIAMGVQSLLRESIVNNFNKYSEKNYCPIYAKENLKRCYEAYHNLGGNSVITELYNKILHMPEQEEKDDEQQNL